MIAFLLDLAVWLGKISHEKMHIASSGKGPIEGQTMLRGREDNLQALSVAEKPNHFKILLGTGRLPLPAPTGSRENQVMGLALEYGQK